MLEPNPVLVRIGLQAAKVALHMTATAIAAFSGAAGYALVEGNLRLDTAQRVAAYNVGAGLDEFAQPSPDPLVGVLSTLSSTPGHIAHAL